MSMCSSTLSALALHSEFSDAALRDSSPVGVVAVIVREGPAVES